MEPYSTCPLLSWITNPCPLDFWSFLSSFPLKSLISNPLVYLSSNHPNMGSFLVCPLLFSKTGPIFHIFSVLCLLKLWSAGSLGPLLLFSYCPPNFLSVWPRPLSSDFVTMSFVSLTFRIHKFLWVESDGQQMKPC